MGRPSNARRRLVEAAIDVIFAQSYASVSVDELCAAAGVNKSSFYHFFSSKQELVLVAIESHWQWFEAILVQAFSENIPPQEQLLRFFDLVMERQQAQKQRSGHMRGCPAGNLTLEMSTQDELLRLRVERLFREWLSYFEHMLYEAKAQHLVPANLDSATTAQALLAYFEGVMLLAKGRNDPSLLHTLRTGALSLMQY